MREQLLDAAEKMVQERGLNAVSFQQLADAVARYELVLDRKAD